MSRARFRVTSEKADFNKAHCALAFTPLFMRSWRHELGY